MRIEVYCKSIQEVGVKWDLAEGRCWSDEMVSGSYLFRGLMPLCSGFL